MKIPYLIVYHQLKNGTKAYPQQLQQQQKKYK